MILVWPEKGEGFEIKDGVLKKYHEEYEAEPFPYEEWEEVPDVCDIRAYSTVKIATIPKGVTKIGDGAFEFCDWLTLVTIPDSVTEIGARAFAGCKSLEDVNIPKSVREIGDWAFENCDSLEDVTIPEGVTKIGDGAFWFCLSLESITIPETLEILGDDIFGGCTNLSNLIVPDRILSEKASLAQLHQFFDIANEHDLTELKMRVMHIKHERFPEDEQQENDFSLD